jgi:hypothetical protein|tara:strand:+ start:492 stop:923 length:432 start_codon:yes stop_codon:yes gene_type:complete
MSKWDKNRFTEHMTENCSREVAKIGNAIIDFSEKYADEVSWGRGNDHGTLTFRCNSDFGVLPLFHMTSEGTLNIQVNFLRSKGVPRQILLDVVRKLESNFLREYDAVMYDVDTFEPISELFFTSSQVDKFLNTMEGCCYRLRQ